MGRWSMVLYPDESRVQEISVCATGVRRLSEKI